MIDLDQLRAYLPSYLSEASYKELFSELKQFPDNIDERFYTPESVTDSYVRQGDGLEDMPVVKLPSSEVRGKPVLVVSNTCDISPENDRAVRPRVMYCPIIDYEKYSYLVRSSDRYDTKQAADNYLKEVRSQKVTSIFYLPRGNGMDESLALLGRVSNCAMTEVYENQKGKNIITKERIFSLSLYGFYILLLKLSIHFTRFREGLVRGE